MPPPPVVAPSNSFGNIQTKTARTLMGESSGAPFLEARQVSGSPPDPREKHACSGRLLLASLSQGGTSTPRNGPHWNLYIARRLSTSRAKRGEQSIHQHHRGEHQQTCHVHTAPTQYSNSLSLKWNKTLNRSEASLQVLLLFYLLKFRTC